MEMEGNIHPLNMLVSLEWQFNIVVLVCVWLLLGKVLLFLLKFVSFLVEWDFTVKALRHFMCCVFCNDRFFFVRWWKNLCLLLSHGYNCWYLAFHAFESSLECLSTTLTIPIKGLSMCLFCCDIDCIVLCNYRGSYYCFYLLGGSILCLFRLVWPFLVGCLL